MAQSVRPILRPDVLCPLTLSPHAQCPPWLRVLEADRDAAKRGLSPDAFLLHPDRIVVAAVAAGLLEGVEPGGIGQEAKALLYDAQVRCVFEMIPSELGWGAIAPPRFRRTRGSWSKNAFFSELGGEGWTVRKSGVFSGRLGSARFRHPSLARC